MSIVLKDRQWHRLAVLGLDGLPLDLARRLGDTLPNIARIAAEADTVDAEIPELSPVNWTSMFTGKGPEEHGVFGFARFDPDTYRSSPASFDAVACRTIFDRLGEAGRVSRVINLPNTYPARPIRGMLVAGFVAEDLDRAVQPPFLLPKLKEAGYLIEPETANAAADPAGLLQGLRESLKARRKALDMLWPDLGWDLFVFVLTETDRLFHFLFTAVTDAMHPLHRECMDFLREWDKAVGDFLQRYDALPEPKRLMVHADHGFTELKTEVCLNTWLVSNGLLALDFPPEGEWDSSKVSPQARAFALDPGRIYLHRRSRFSRGCLRDADSDRMIPELKAALEGLTHAGEQVMERVFTADELYPGPLRDRAPDLVCLARPGYDLKAKFGRDSIFGFHGRTGAHTIRGAIWYDSQGSKPRRMREIGQEILKHFNLDP